jgi:choline dehydrogenase-like flavoprotein
VQLPAARSQGVEIVTRAEVLSVGERSLAVRVRARQPGEKGRESEWAPGAYRVAAQVVIVAAGAVGSPTLLLRSGFGATLPALGAGFTCHPAHILVAEHERAITNDVGHPKSFYIDRAAEEGYVLETCMYFPFTTAKNLTGFGPAHSALMRAFPRLQMILVLACDKAVPENRVTVDRGGKPVVHYRFTRQTIEAMVRATRASAKIFFAAGALRVHAPSADPPLIERGDAARADRLIDARHFLPGKVSVSAAHLMGGCAMGRDAATSVTDARGRVHGIPWLRVADASLFPDSLEINPYLTIMALADRVAEGVRTAARDLLGAPAGGA